MECPICFTNISCRWMDCETCKTNMRMEAKSFVTKCLPITIKKEEIGLSRQQFIENRKITRKKAREKAHEKKWEDLKATMARLHEDVLRRGSPLQPHNM